MGRRDLHADAARLGELHAEMQRIHDEMTEIMGGGDPRADVVLSELGTTLHLTRDYLPFAREAADGAAGRREAVAGYLAGRYQGPPRQG